MELSALSDAELVELARGGSAPAFAVLLHRHGPAVRATVRDDADPTGAVIDTYVTAMRRLDDEPHDGASVRPWLLDLAASKVRDPVAVGDEPLPDLDPDELDEIWAELDLRWPNGRVRRHVPGWLGWTALVVALVSLGVLVPYLAVSWADDDEGEREWDVLRAEPFEHDDLELEEEPEEVEDEDGHFELPTFEFDEPPPPPTTDPDPDPEPAPPPPPEEEPEVEDPEPEEDEEPVEEQDENDDENVENDEEDDEEEDGSGGGGGDDGEEELPPDEDTGDEA